MSCLEKIINTIKNMNLFGKKNNHILKNSNYYNEILDS